MNTHYVEDPLLSNAHSFNSQSWVWTPWFNAQFLLTYGIQCAGIPVNGIAFSHDHRTPALLHSDIAFTAF